MGKCLKILPQNLVTKLPPLETIPIAGPLISNFSLCIQWCLIPFLVVVFNNNSKQGQDWLRNSRTVFWSDIFYFQKKCRYNSDANWQNFVFEICLNKFFYSKYGIWHMLLKARKSAVWQRNNILLRHLCNKITAQTWTFILRKVTWPLKELLLVTKTKHRKDNNTSYDTVDSWIKQIQ